MAYDWYSKLLYMTSITTSQILVVRMNTRDFPQRILVNETIGVHGIALDPLQGYVKNIKKTFLVTREVHQLFKRFLAQFLAIDRTDVY